MYVERTDCSHAGATFCKNSGGSFLTRYDKLRVLARGISNLIKENIASSAAILKPGRHLQIS